MSGSFNSDPIGANQRQLFPGNVFNLPPTDHDCHLFHDLFQQLDRSRIESQYSPLGQRAYHSRKVVGILIYGYSHGVFSSRQLEKRCNEDLSFMYIVGKDCPNFRVLSNFRQHLAVFFHECFMQTVKIAMSMKLASLGHVSLDGSKFQANSSRHKTMMYKFLKEKEQALGQEVDALIKQANVCDVEEEAAYQEKTGYEYQKTRPSSSID